MGVARVRASAPRPGRADGRVRAAQGRPGVQPIAEQPAAEESDRRRGEKPSSYDSIALSDRYCKVASRLLHSSQARYILRSPFMGRSWADVRKRLVAVLKLHGVKEQHLELLPAEAGATPIKIEVPPGP